MSSGLPTLRFEEGYIARSYRSITSRADIALTELVANAWDAGASNVFITIPSVEDSEISITDDGTGMTADEFQERWMVLSYDRQKHQGQNVLFPEQNSNQKRMAYGRNGIGRHGMFCFSDRYVVETWQNGICNKYIIEVASGEEPFKIIDNFPYEREGHGTRVSAYVNKHLPNIAEMESVISARFLYDPQFVVRINDVHVDLTKHEGLYSSQEIKLENKVSFKMTIIDSTKTARKSQQHGIAFWVGGRLVGKPSWTHGDVQYLDGRYKIAKKYTVILQTNDLIDEIQPDWSGFIDTPNMQNTYRFLKQHIDDFLRGVMSEHIQDTQNSVIADTKEELLKLPTYEQREVSMLMEEIMKKNPMTSPESLQTAIRASLTISQSQKGRLLLDKLSTMSQAEIDNLADLLLEWDVEDIVSVLREIDKRIIVIEAISRIFDDVNTDELHTLHPLVLNARWLFGAEFDSPMFTSNKTLGTVVKKLFKDEDYDETAIEHSKKRPDIVCLKKYSFKAVCTEKKDADDDMMKPDQVLIVELKRGGSEISPEEVSQAENYVRQIKKSALLHKDAIIRAFVVGANIGDVDRNKKTDSGNIHVISYAHLVDSAKGKLFGLKGSLQEHYDKLENKSIVENALKICTKPLPLD